jgi:hypothetical protein
MPLGCAGTRAANAGNPSGNRHSRGPRRDRSTHWTGQIKAVKFAPDFGRNWPECLHKNTEVRGNRD